MGLVAAPFLSSEGNSMFFKSTVSAAAFSIPVTVDCILTGGYYDEGDGGGALFIRTGSLVTGGFIDAGGGFWELGKQQLNVKMFGADGVADHAALSAAINVCAARSCPLYFTANVVAPAWTRKVLNSTLTIYGNNYTLFTDGNDVFDLNNSSSIYIYDVEFNQCGVIFSLNSANNYENIVFENCQFIDTGSMCLGGCLDLDFINVKNCIFSGTVGEAVIDLSSYIKSAYIVNNKFLNISSTTSVLQVLNFGKTQIADQPLTGNYIVNGNVFDTITSNGSTLGELHAIIVYGERAVISNNIIKDIDRPLSRQSGGVEGIYTKIVSGVISNNVLINAGFSNGNKGAMINVKGFDLGNVAETNGANIAVVGNSLYSTNSEARNGIRCEASNVTITSNTLTGINGQHAIALSWPFDENKNAVISDNVISIPNITVAHIWINCSGENIKIVDNSLDKNQSSGAFNGILVTGANRTETLKNISISNNNINATGLDYGIYFLSNTINISNIQCNNNNIIGGNYGIRTLSNSTLLSGVVNANTMTDTVAAFRDKATTTLRFRDNTLNGAPADLWAAAPSTGAWSVGNKAYASNPAALGFEGWICTVAGTPGTWKTFGAVTP